MFHDAKTDSTEKRKKNHQAKIMRRRAVFVRPRISFMLYKFIWHDSLQSYAEYKIQKKSTKCSAREMDWILKTYHIRNRWVGCRDFFSSFCDYYGGTHVNMCPNPTSFRYFASTVFTKCTHCTCNCARVQLRKLDNETCCKNAPKIRCKAMLVSNLCHIPNSIDTIIYLKSFKMIFEWSERDCRILIIVTNSPKTSKIRSRNHETPKWNQYRQQWIYVVLLHINLLNFASVVWLIDSFPFAVRIKTRCNGLNREQLTDKLD